jgi:hypothetical protein
MIAKKSDLPRPTPGLDVDFYRTERRISQDRLRMREEEEVNAGSFG